MAVGLQRSHNTFTLSQCVCDILKIPPHSCLQANFHHAKFHSISPLRCADGHQYATVRSHCGSLHFWECPLHAYRWNVSRSLRFCGGSGIAASGTDTPTKEQRKSGGQLLDCDPAMRQVRNNQSSLLRRPCSSLDKASHSTVVQRIDNGQRIVWRFFSHDGRA